MTPAHAEAAKSTSFATAQSSEISALFDIFCIRWYIMINCGNKTLINNFNVIRNIPLFVRFKLCVVNCTTQLYLFKKTCPILKKSTQNVG
jgi:hypothetical protein